MKKIVPIIALILMSASCNAPLAPHNPVETGDQPVPAAQKNFQKLYQSAEYGFDMAYPDNYSYLTIRPDSDLFYVGFGLAPLPDDGPVDYSVTVLKGSINSEMDYIQDGPNYKNIQTSSLGVDGNRFTIVKWQQPSLPGANDFIDREAALIEKNNLSYRIDPPSFTADNELSEFLQNFKINR